LNLSGERIQVLTLEKSNEIANAILTKGREMNLRPLSSAWPT